MTRISYAQNFEDVMLARALADVSEGFYVDVGAQDPLIDSVTRMFYEQGWKGINVEPVPHWFERLKADRPRDVNLMCAVASSTGKIELHEVSGTGLTTASGEYAGQHAAAGWMVRTRTVPARKLDSILARYAPETIHFLKIDVEGMEHEVLKGLSLQRYRPWILVIEATRPNTNEDVSVAWEQLVLESDYRLAYRDGLNRFYLAEEQISRLPAFDLPPNVFDDFKAYREQASNDYALDLERRLQELHDTSAQWRSGLEEAAARAESYRTDLLAVTDTAKAQQERMGTLESALQQRQALLEERAAQAESYRTDLLAVTDTAKAQQERIGTLESALQQRQALLEETAAKAESYRIDLLAVTDTAKAQQKRMDELVEAIGTREAEHEQTVSLLRRDLHSVAAAAENRRILIEDLEAKHGQREVELRQVQSELRHKMILLDGLRREVDAIYASRSWKLTAPLRSLAGSMRHMAGRGLRAAAAIAPLRRLAGGMLKGRLRERILALAGFSVGKEESASANAQQPGLESVYASQPPVVSEPPQAQLSRAGARAYRLVETASGHDVHGGQ